MSETNSNSGEDLSDEEDDEEELDPRVNDELEKLNVAANSINHLEAELDEARAVFRQTMAGATYHLQLHSQKLGKSIEKAHPFYESLREMRRTYHQLQAATFQFEKANSRHISARQRVREAEQRASSCVDNCSFDFDLQEMLNQATVEVNEAESKKRESWEAHQKIYKSYQTSQQRAKELQSKLKKSIEKARPYFYQKVEFDRYLWHLKLRVDAIQEGLNEAKVIYSNCLKSVELISDDIRQKRKDKRLMALPNKFHEREAGVGAESSNEDETSLNQSQLDLDLDCDTTLSELDGIIPGQVSEIPPLSVGAPLHSLSSGENSSHGACNITDELGDLSFKSVPARKLERMVSGAESAQNLDFDSVGDHSSFLREVYGSERNDSFEGEGTSKDSIEPNEIEKTEEREDNLPVVINTASSLKTNLCEVAHHDNWKGGSAISKESFDSLPQTEGKQVVDPVVGDKEGKGTESI